MHVRMTRDDLYTPGAFGRTPAGERLAAIGALSPDELQTGLQRLELDQQAARSLLVGGLRWSDIDRPQQPERIHQQMPCLALHLLTPVIALAQSGFFRGFHALAIYDRC